MDAIEIRKAVPGDAAAVADYHHRCFMITYSSQLLAGEFAGPDREGIRQQFASWFRTGSVFETWVAVVDSVPVGHFTIDGRQLIHLFVDPDHQRKGLGRILLARGEAMIVANGYMDFELHARVENLAAITFYERAGWTVTNRLIHTVEYGVGYDEYVLIKHRS